MSESNLSSDTSFLRHRESRAVTYRNVHIGILGELNLELDSSKPILDFGCGEGSLVLHYRKLGIKAFGIDVRDGFKSYENQLRDNSIARGDQDILRLINLDQYRIPFEDGYFQFIFSHQVLEHVQNYEQAVSEMRRVLAKDGFCLHIFPPRTSLFEGHTNVPFGALINSPAYYKFWAKLGIRTNNQRELNSKEVAQHNYNYVKQNTNYLPEGELVKVFSKHFAKIDFVEGLYLKYRIQPVGGLIYRLPGVAWGIRTFVSRAILLRV